MEKKKVNKLAVFITFILTTIVSAGAIYYMHMPKDTKTTKDTAKKEEKKVSIKDVTKDYKEHNGKDVDIYSYTNEDVAYYDTSANYAYGDSEYTIKKVGTIKCIGSTCTPAIEDGTYSDKYILMIESDNTISLYDFTKNLLIYNEKLHSHSADENNKYGFLTDDENIYGYYENYLVNKVEYTSVYSLLSNEFYADIKGVAGLTTPSIDGSVVGGRYAPIAIGTETTDSEGVTYVEYDAAIMDLKTGKRVSTIKGGIVKSFELKDKTYILSGNYSITDINGNIKFSDIQSDSYANNVYYEKNKLVFAKNNKFYVYDADLKLKKESKSYTKILMMGKDFVLAVDGTKLVLLDHSGNILTTFLTDYNELKYYVHVPLSGWYTDQGKNGIYIVIGQDDPELTYENIKKYNPDVTLNAVETEDKGFEYYYIPSTKETGKIPTLIGGYAKPVLYLYPTKKTNVTVNFEHEDMLTTTYPKFNKEWSVIANTNGDLYDKNGNYYYALYWEENGNHRVDFSEGFYVEKEDAIKFLEEKLSYIGLNKKERNEFIMYWLPVLEKNKKNLVYFELNEERDSYNKLIINPKPDSMLRIAIHVKKVDKKTNIKEQKLTKFNRTGFAAIEWGGVQY